MPVTIRNTSATPKLNRFRYSTEDLTSEEVLKRVWSDKRVGFKELLQSSYNQGKDYKPSSNGFIWAVCRAYNEHQSLIIRPDDILVAILSQLNLYVNAHAEELHAFFVEHTDQKELEVREIGNRYTVDFGAMAQSMSQQLKENIKDPLLHDWIMPNFTTTSVNDKIICSVMMMSTFRSYFRYTMMSFCGIPSITLLGERSDYESLLIRLDKLATLGREPHTFARLLRPILTQFINVFDAPPVMDFWTKICHYRGGSGSNYIGGWITAFCAWGAEGKWMGHDIQNFDEPETEKERDYTARYESMASSPYRSGMDLPVLILDGVRYPVVNTRDVPDGFCQVDVKLVDNGQEFKCMMVSGHVGYVERDDLEPDAKTGETKKNTLQPSPEWFMFVKDGGIDSATRNSSHLM